MAFAVGIFYVASILSVMVCFVIGRSKDMLRWGSSSGSCSTSSVLLVIFLCRMTAPSIDVSKLFGRCSDRLGLLALRPRNSEVQSRVTAADLCQRAVGCGL